MSNFEHLVLLVGTNPLPNFVVSKYFLENNKKLKCIWLVHSEENEKQRGTNEFANNIKDVLENKDKNYNVCFEFVSLESVYSAKVIEEDIKKQIIYNISSLDEKVHLNYTGGTKSMAVHVYRILEKEFKNNISFSYLDARFSRLVDDEKISSFMCDDMCDDLRKIIKVSLEELIELHGYKKKYSGNDYDIIKNINEWNNVLNSFDTLFKKDNPKICFKTLLNFLNSIYYNKNNEFIDKKSSFYSEHNLKDKENIKKIRKEYQNLNCEIKKIINNLPKKYSILDDAGQLWIPKEEDTNKDFKSRIKTSVHEFLHGKWLEVYIYRILKKEIKAFNNSSLHANVNLKRNVDKTNDFELDLLIINGYEVCGISCTTDDRYSLCKSKGFEVVHRVNQFGGDLSKAILITFLGSKNTEIMTSDLVVETGTDKSKILVIGIEDFKGNTVWEKIKEHIWEG